MTASALRALDERTDGRLGDLADRLPDDLVERLSTQMDDLEVGRRAAEAVDRLRGRRRRSPWRWVAGLLVVGVVVTVAATVIQMWMTRGRSEPWEDDLDLEELSPEAGSGSGTGTEGSAESALGLSAAEGSLLSYDPNEDRGA